MSTFEELKSHSFSNIVGMGISFIWTKIFFWGARLIRRPFFFRGNKSNFKYGEGFTTGRGCRIELFDEGIIHFGNRCHIGDYVHIASSGRVDIGDDCLFASKIYISDTSHGSYDVHGDSPVTPPDCRSLVHSFVKIGKNVWLGENVVILPSVKIGDGCIIGANSTVTKDIPPNTIAAGSPALVIKEYDFTKGEWRRCSK